MPVPDSSRGGYDEGGDMPVPPSFGSAPATPDSGWSAWHTQRGRIDRLAIGQSAR